MSWATRSGGWSISVTSTHRSSIFQPPFRNRRTAFRRARRTRAGPPLRSEPLRCRVDGRVPPLSRTRRARCNSWLAIAGTPGVPCATRPSTSSKPMGGAGADRVQRRGSLHGIRRMRRRGGLHERGLRRCEPVHRGHVRLRAGVLEHAARARDGLLRRRPLHRGRRVHPGRVRSRHLQARGQGRPRVPEGGLSDPRLRRQGALHPRPLRPEIGVRPRPRAGRRGAFECRVKPATPPLSGPCWVAATMGFGCSARGNGRGLRGAPKVPGDKTAPAGSKALPTYVD